MNVKLIESIERLITDAVHFGESVGFKAESRGYTDEHVNRLVKQYAESKALVFADSHGLSERKPWER